MKSVFAIFVFFATSQAFALPQDLNCSAITDKGDYWTLAVHPKSADFTRNSVGGLTLDIATSQASENDDDTLLISGHADVETELPFSAILVDEEAHESFCSPNATSDVTLPYSVQLIFDGKIYSGCCQ